jgi:hypothetical protein
MARPELTFGTQIAAVKELAAMACPNLKSALIPEASHAEVKVRASMSLACNPAKSAPWD